MAVAARFVASGTFVHVLTMQVTKTISVIAGARILHLLHYLLLVPMTL